MPDPGTAAAAASAVRPLRRGDPPSLGEAQLVGRLSVSDAGIVYAATLAGEQVAVALLTAGAETDSFARARFHDAVADYRSESDGSAVAGSPVVATGDEPDTAPWVAVKADSWDDGAKAAAALLGPVTLRGLAPVGDVRGPGYRPHWADRGGPGRWRAWPLPWPSAFSAAGRWTYVASFALVVAIASIALFISVKLFENQPPAPVPPPYPSPTQQSPTPSPSPSPTSPSPTPSPSTGAPRTTVTTIPPIV